MHRHPLRQIEPLDREVHEDVQLVAEPALGAEALQVHDEDVGGLPQLEGLAGAAVLLAARAVPRVVLRQDLGPAELVEAVAERDAVLLARRALAPRALERRVGQQVALLPGGRAAQLVGGVPVDGAEERVVRGQVPLEHERLAEAEERGRRRLVGVVGGGGFVVGGGVVGGRLLGGVVGGGGSALACARTAD